MLISVSHPIPTLDLECILPRDSVLYDKVKAFVINRQPQIFLLLTYVPSSFLPALITSFYLCVDSIHNNIKVSNKKYGLRAEILVPWLNPFAPAPYSHTMLRKLTFCDLILTCLVAVRQGAIQFIRQQIIFFNSIRIIWATTKLHCLLFI